MRWFIASILSLLLTNFSVANVVGFVSQTYTKSDEPYVMSTKGQSFDPSSFAIRYNHIGHEIIPYSYTLGVLYHSEFDSAIPLASVTIPWYVDSCLPCIRNQVTFGRFGNAFGFFHETLSSPSTNGMVVIPMGVYNRTFLASSWHIIDGIGFTNTVNTRNFSNSFHVAYGTPLVTNQKKTNDIFFRYAPENNLSMEAKYIIKVINSLTINYKHTILLQYYNQQYEAQKGEETTLFDVFIMQEPKVNLEAYFIGYRYQNRNYEFLSEAYTLYTHHENSFGYSGGYKQTYGWYTIGRYNMDKASFFVGYTKSPGEVRKRFRNVNNVPDYYTYGKDTFFGLSYRMKNNLTLTAEHHIMEGTSWIPEKVENGKYWDMTIFSLTYNF